MCISKCTVFWSQSWSPAPMLPLWQEGDGSGFSQSLFVLQDPNLWEWTSRTGLCLTWNFSHYFPSWLEALKIWVLCFSSLCILLKLSQKEMKFPHWHFFFYFSEWNFRQHERFVLSYLLLCLLSHSVVPSLCVLAYVSWKSTYSSKTSCIFPEIQERMRLAILPKLKWAKIGCCSNLLHFWFQ